MKITTIILLVGILVLTVFITVMSNFNRIIMFVTDVNGAIIMSVISASIVCIFMLLLDAIVKYKYHLYTNSDMMQTHFWIIWYVTFTIMIVESVFLLCARELGYTIDMKYGIGCIALSFILGIINILSTIKYAKVLFIQGEQFMVKKEALETDN